MHIANTRRSLTGSNEGASTLEMALLLPVLLVVVFGLVEFGYNLFARTTVEKAAQLGAPVGRYRREIRRGHTSCACQVEGAPAHRGPHRRRPELHRHHRAGTKLSRREHVRGRSGERRRSPLRRGGSTGGLQVRPPYPYRGSAATCGNRRHGQGTHDQRAVGGLQITHSHRYTARGRIK